MDRVPELDRAIRRSDRRRPVGPTCDSSETVVPCERSAVLLTSRSSTTRTAPPPVAEQRAISPAPASRKNLCHRRDAGRMTQTPRAPSRCEGPRRRAPPAFALRWPGRVGSERSATALFSSNPRTAHRTCSVPSPVLEIRLALASSGLPAMRRLRLAPPMVFAAVSLSGALCSPATRRVTRPAPTVFLPLSLVFGAFCLCRRLSRRIRAVAAAERSPSVLLFREANQRKDQKLGQSDLEWPAGRGFCAAPPADRRLPPRRLGALSTRQFSVSFVRSRLVNQIPTVYCRGVLFLLDQVQAAAPSAPPRDSGLRDPSRRRPRPADASRVCILRFPPDVSSTLRQVEDCLILGFLFSTPYTFSVLHRVLYLRCHLCLDPLPLAKADHHDLFLRSTARVRHS